MYSINKWNRKRKYASEKQTTKNESTQYTLITTIAIVGLYKFISILIELSSEYSPKLELIPINIDIVLYLTLIKLSIGILIGAYGPILIYLIFYFFYLSNPEEYLINVNKWYINSIQIIIISINILLILSATVLIYKIALDNKYENFIVISILGLIIGVFIYLIVIKIFNVNINKKLMIYESIVIVLSFIILLKGITVPDISIELDKLVYSNNDGKVHIKIVGDIYDKIYIKSFTQERKYPVKQYYINKAMYIQINFNSSYFIEDEYIIEAKKDGKIYSNSFIYMFDEETGDKAEYINRWKEKFYNTIKINSIKDEKINSFMSIFVELFSDFDTEFLNKELVKLDDHCKKNKIESIEELINQVKHDQVIGVKTY
jgi:hypothetical protein